MADTINTYYETVPARLREFRKALNLSQDEFGKLLELDQTAISGMEVGRQDVTLRTMYALIKADCNPTWLLLGSGPMLYSATVQAEATVEVRQTSQATEYVVRVKATKG
ncbi:helix-turn-helix domain-containing protein [Spirosoma utsteinense]|uniref:helix-turn-helix domain-containing protein n=1 Tax=Spirosoma utsteinense TaxID=2585773 RepID=UPI0016442B13|nr:helix-turn-helix transcriptional regulator [Spirosoma utsteinense]MBC3785754.1 transcriptional regulator with XRE-family HTH domain [Spirosoma utsteinense]